MRKKITLTLPPKMKTTLPKTIPIQTKIKIISRRMKTPIIITIKTPQVQAISTLKTQIMIIRMITPKHKIKIAINNRMTLTLIVIKILKATPIQKTIQKTMPIRKIRKLKIKILPIRIRVMLIIPIIRRTQTQMKITPKKTMIRPSLATL